MVPGTSDGAFEALYRREFAVLVRLATVICGDVGVAQEVTQEAFVRLLDRWPRVGSYDAPGAWLRRVTIRLAVRRRSRAERDAPLLDGLVAAHHHDGDGSEQVALLPALAALPTQQRIAVTLHYLHGLPIDQIAADLGKRPGTIKAQLHTARATLATALHDAQEEDADAHR